MRTMLISTVILFTTVVSAVAIGIAAGYAAIWAILAAFGRQPALPEPALVTVEATSEPLAASR